MVLGNCGFGFAPVRPAERDRAMLTTSRSEAIGLRDRGALLEGMAADVIVYDLGRIRRTPPTGRGPRSRATSPPASGAGSGATPGRLLRHGR